MENYIQQIKKEIEDLHTFFTEWFNGILEESKFVRVEEALHPNFELITPRGEHFRREEILDLIKKTRGGDPKRKIWTEFLSCKKYGEIAVALYYELQDLGDQQTKRISSAIFSLEQGLKWLHVHETWVK